jgi:hypothetical protein
MENIKVGEFQAKQPWPNKGKEKREKERDLIYKITNGRRAGVWLKQNSSCLASMKC